MCGKYEDFKTYFVGQKSVLTGDNNKIKVPIRYSKLTQPTVTDKFEEWKPEGIYKDWFGFKIREVKEKEFKRSDNKQWGLKPFQINYKVRKPKKYIYADTFKVKTICVAITPSGLENVKTHAAGIWKIESIQVK